MATKLLLLPPILLLILPTLILLNGPWKAPFRPSDLLPLLPRPVSWTILSSLHSAVDLLPTFIGAATSSPNSSLNWKGACFYNNTAWMVFHNKSSSPFGGGTLHIKVIIWFQSQSIWKSWVFNFLHKSLMMIDGVWEFMCLWNFVRIIIQNTFFLIF